MLSVVGHNIPHKVICNILKDTSPQEIKFSSRHTHDCLQMFTFGTTPKSIFEIRKKRGHFILQACHFFIFVSSEVLVRMGLFLEKNDRNSELFPFHQKTPLGQMMPEPLYRIYVRVATLCSVYDNYHTIIGIESKAI